MFLNARIYLKPTIDQIAILEKYEDKFKKEVLRVNEVFKKNGYSFEYRYKSISNFISFNSKYLVLLEAKKMYKEGILFKFHYSSLWSTLSYQVSNELILELGLFDHKKLVKIEYYTDEYMKNLISLGNILTMSLVKKNKKWIANIMVELIPELSKEKGVMGVDIGIKVPAVVALENGKVKFFGNGREIRFKQRQLRSHIQHLQRTKQYKKLKKFKHKLHFVLNDYDHKISKEIIDFAIDQKIGVIKLEKLTGIVRSFDIDIYQNIYLWSYRRLQECIVYKAEKNGIRIQYVNPYNTSKKCPRCGKLNNPADRHYSCSCGFTGHRDAVGAMNILHAL